MRCQDSERSEDRHARFARRMQQQDLVASNKSHFCPAGAMTQCFPKSVNQIARADTTWHRSTDRTGTVAFFGSFKNSDEKFRHKQQATHRAQSSESSTKVIST